MGDDWWSLRFFNLLEELAPPLGYRVEPFWVHPKEMPAARLDKILRARGVRGIILPSLPAGVEGIDFLWEPYAVVALSETVLTPRVHSVQVGTSSNIRTIIENLAELGYRKPLLAVHDRFHFGMHGIHEGAFMMATTGAHGRGATGDPR